jgi:hypothetical protein
VLARRCLVTLRVIILGYPLLRVDMRGLRAEPLTGFSPPRLAEEMCLDVVDEREKPVLEYPALFGWVTRMPDAQCSVGVVAVG